MSIIVNKEDGSREALNYPCLLQNKFSNAVILATCKYDYTVLTASDNGALTVGEIITAGNTQADCWKLYTGKLTLENGE